MIAEIYGKISSTGSNLSDRLEDQLTGDAFGTLRYLDDHLGLLPFLELSYFLPQAGKPLQLTFEHGIIKHIRFWPWVAEAEPDVLIELTEKGGQNVVIVVEVKYYSALSSDDTSPQALESDNTMPSDPATMHGLEDTSLVESQNQLIRQMRGMRTMYPGYRRVQILLTTNHVYPRELLASVWRQAKAEDLETELYWLSWHDLTSVLEQSLQQQRGKLSEREERIIADLLMLCERKGFARFSQLTAPTNAPPQSVSLVLQAPYPRPPTPVGDRVPLVPQHIPSPIPHKDLDAHAADRAPIVKEDRWPPTSC